MLTEAGATQQNSRVLTPTPVLPTQKADLWSCGVILFALLYGRYPFDASERRCARKVVTADYIIPDQVAVSAECKTLVQRLLCPDPKARICMEDILAQPWFREGLAKGALTMNDYYLATSADLNEVITAVMSVTVVLKESSEFGKQAIILHGQWLPSQHVMTTTIWTAECHHAC